MPEFRKSILALAAVALTAGIASAQVGTPTGPGGTQAPTCTTTNGAVTPTLRSEGYTELTGDIVIVCQGGSPPALGSLIPTANITIFLNTAVTSRLLQATAAGNASEALLLIDEPGSGLSGYGPGVLAAGAVGPVICGSPNVGAGAGGCTEWVGNSTVTPPAGSSNSGVPISVNPNTGAGGAYVATSQPPGANAK